MKGAPTFFSTVKDMGAKRATIIPKAAVARILMNTGASRVSEDAAEALVELLEERGKAITQQANRIAHHAGRKTVQGGDIKLSAKQ